MFTFWLYIVVTGIVAGILGALLGVGGGIIMLPATQLLLGFDPIISVGTTLFAIIFTTISGAYGHYRHGNVQIKSGLLVGAGGVIGVVLGSYVFKAYLTTNITVLKVVLGVLFLIMAVRMGRESYQEWKKSSLNGQQPAVKSQPGQKAWGLPLLGLFTGTLTGMMGLGGGFIMVPAMIWFFRAAPYEAVGTTLLAMLPIAALGGFIKLYQGYVNIPAALILGLGTIVGAQLGVYISGFIKQLVFKVAFAIIFAYLAFSYLSTWI